jgi:hypothetical protein
VMDIFHVFQMVGATRGTPEGFRPDQASGSVTFRYLGINTLNSSIKCACLILYICVQI